QGKIAEEKALKDPKAIQAAKEALAENGNLTPTNKQLVEQIRNTASASYGTGSDLQRAIQAATAITQGLTGGNLGQALAGGSAPYLAHEISKYLPADQSLGANLMAHAVLGAVVGHFSGNATVGAVSAFTAEAAAPAIIKAMGWDKDSLTEKQKQTVSALATLAAGLAGGLVGDSSSSAVAGAQAGKNAVENNLLGGGTEDGQIKAAQEHAKNIMSCADNPGSASCQKGLAMQDALMVAIPAGLGGGLLAAASPEIAALLKAGMEYCAGSLFLCVNNLGLQASEIIVPGGVGAGGAIGVGKTVAEATAAKAEAAAVNSAKEVWKSSSVQSRVNLRNGDSSTASGLEYAWKKHGGEWGANKSHFTMTKDELKTVLQSDTVVKTPVQYSPSTGNYIRTVDMGKNIGVDAMNNRTPTSIMTVITDKQGNLVNTFPGKTVVR
ncbi:VENN motif pre-toxin domain-containing protein, partial [Yersinia enterocolitica]